MHWETMYGNRDQYEARLREIEEARLAHRIWAANHPLPKFADALKVRLGRWLVVKGTALQSGAESSFGEGKLTRTEWTPYVSAPDW